MEYKVVVTDHVFPHLDVEREELKKIGAFLIESKGSDEESILEVAYDADAVLTCYAQLGSSLIGKLQQCQVIARYGIGVDNIHLEAASKKGIIVTNVPDYCIEEVSDHAIALILASSRKICQLNSTVKAGRWDFHQYMPVFRLKGQTLGLLGFGSIARRLVEKVAAYQFTILAHDPYIEEGIAREYNVSFVDLERLLEESDILSLHTPLTTETQGILGYEELKKMKKNSFLINTARGGLIQEEALYRVLKEGRLAGAALDFLNETHHVSENPLLSLNNVIITPHAAFYSEEAMHELQYSAVMEVKRVLSGERPKRWINPEIVVKKNAKEENNGKSME